MYDNNNENNTYRFVGENITQDNISSTSSSSGGYTQEANNTYGQQTTQNTSQGTDNADYQRFYTSYEEPKKKKKERKSGKGGSGNGKYFGKVIAAAAVFGLVASLMFTGMNTLLGNLTGSSSSSSSTVVSSSSSSSSTTSASGDSVTTISSSSTTALDVSDVVESVMPSIVSVTSMYQTSGIMSEDYTSVGSGIIVAQTDDTIYIVTNNHVIEDASSITVTFVDDAEVTAEIKGTDSSNDLAVLSVSVSDMESSTLSSITVATLGDSDSVEVGETAIAIGNALGYGQSVTTGVISALNREVTIDGVTNELIQTDAAINPGNSGGALLNSSGEVIGINSAKYSDTDVEGMGYAIPISTAIPIINELIEREAVSSEDSAYLGIAGVDVSSEVAEMYNIPEGVYISQVVSGSAAESAGIEIGDILTSFDGHSISSWDELQELMQYYASGTEVEVVVERSTNDSYEEVTLTVTLGSKTSS